MKIHAVKRILDRVPQFDERSRSFRSVEGIEHLPFRNYTWPLKLWLDQGQEGACVGFGIAHELAAIPVQVMYINDAYAFQIYEEAKKIDVWPGENYQGTSVLAGLKVAKNMGLIEEYRWAFGLEDFLRTCGRKGPVIFGLNWYTGMMNPDRNGFIHKTGIVEGGHCILGRGTSVKYFMTGDKYSMSNVDKKKGYAIFHNSWGRSWGYNGTCKISLEDLEALLYEQGECAIPTIRNAA